MLVVDANVALTASAQVGGWAAFEGEELVGPPLLWPEVRSTLHRAVAQGKVSHELATQALIRFDSGVVHEKNPRGLGQEVWRIADRLGWAKTYDAEYLALASLLQTAVVTFDRRMLKAAERLGLVSEVSQYPL